MKTLLLYTTSSCHLCEMAAVLIRPYLDNPEVSLRLVEISDSDSLIDRYGIRIPVLGLEGEEKELAWPFDESMLHEFLRGFENA